MDLYFQIGVLFLILSAFALVAYFSTDALGNAATVERSLNKPSVNYAADSTITNTKFYVDTRVFTQWALNMKDQREVYLMYSSTDSVLPNPHTSIVPDTTVYGQYLWELDYHLDHNDLYSRSVEINPQLPSNTPNAFLVGEHSNKVVSYLALFEKAAELNTDNDVVSVYSFTKDSGEVLYLCFIGR